MPDRTIARIFPDIYCLNGLRCDRYSSDSMSRSLWFREVKYNHNDSRLTLPKKAMVNQDISLDLWEEWSNLKWKDKLQTTEEWISFSSQVMLMVTVRVRACFQWVETSWQEICGSFPDVKLSWQPLRVHPFKLNRDDRMWSLLWQGRWNSPGIGEITFVASDSHHYVGWSVLAKLLHPVLQCLEWFLIERWRDLQDKQCLYIIIRLLGHYLLSLMLLQTCVVTFIQLKTKGVT